MPKLAIESLTRTFIDGAERDAMRKMLCVICIGQSHLASKRDGHAGRNEGPRPRFGEKKPLEQTKTTSAADGQADITAASSQIVEFLGPKLLGGRKHIIFQMIDGSSARDWQHDR